MPVASRRVFKEDVGSRSSTLPSLRTSKLHRRTAGLPFGGGSPRGCVPERPAPGSSLSASENTRLLSAAEVQQKVSQGLHPCCFACASGAMLFSGTSPRFQFCVLRQPLGAGGFRKRGHNHATRAIMSPTTAITHPGMRSIANRSYRCSEGPSVLATATEESSAVSGRTSGRPENRREQPAHAREKYVNPSTRTSRHSPSTQAVHRAQQLLHSGDIAAIQFAWRCTLNEVFDES